MEFTMYDFVKGTAEAAGEATLEDVRELANLQLSIGTRLERHEAINQYAVLRHNELVYKLFPDKQHGLEFEKEETGKEKNCDFGAAIRSVKQGYRCARKGWNGKGQYIELACNISYMTEGGKLANARHSAIGNKAIAFVGTSGTQIGWLASQADMLAEDWYIVKGD